MNIFLGKMEIFDVKLNIKGIDSSKEGLEWIANSIYVVIKGYSGIAESIGNEDTTRSVGSSCNKNPIVIINLCHRVFSKNRNLNGYDCGSSAEQKLFEFENFI